MSIPSRSAYTLKHLESCCLILLQRGAATRKIIDSGLSRHRITSKGVLEVGSCQSVIDFVRLGLGVGLVHDICAAAESQDNIRCVDLSQFFKRSEVTLVHRKTALLGTPHHNLIEVLSAASLRLRRLSPSIKRVKRSIQNSRVPTKRTS